MNSLLSVFLSQSYRDCWDDYQRSIKSDKFPKWDYCILTASNEQQAEGFRAQIEARREYLPAATKYAVIPDRGGERVGSGGATLEVLRYLHDEEGTFEHLRVLVIHSGGDSKRVPQYSALGKLFSPVPHELPDGRSATLFDEFLISMSSVPSRIREGMLLLSGDVLLLFNPLQIDYNNEGAAAISFKEDVHTGRNHGVYLNGDNGNVRRCLQKKSVDTLKSVGAVNEAGCVDIDTGAVIFSTKMMESLYGLVSTEELYDAHVNSHVRLSLYADFLYPLGEDATLEDFYKEKPEGELSPELTSARTKVWKAMRPFRMRLLRLAPAKFIHFGTTREILALMSGGVDDYADLSWHRSVGSSVPVKTAGYGSVLCDGAVIGEESYLEVSYVGPNAIVGNHVLLSYIDIQDEVIPDNVVLHGLKQRDGRFVVRIYGVDDNPKENRLFGQDLDEFMVRLDESMPAETAHSLWMAPLYPVKDTIREAVAAALNLYNLVHGKGDLASFKAAERKSLCSGFNDADPEAIIAWNARMADLVHMEKILAAIRKGTPVRELPHIRELSKVQNVWLRDRLGEAGFSEKMRLCYYLGSLLDDENLVSECFATIRNVILNVTMESLAYNETAKIVTDRHTVKLPLRVNWGGGWSDTPPYCNEHGGTVLNCAILLNGEKPVEATLERIDDLKVIFDSRDMDVHGEFDTIGPLQETGDPFDPFALQKACLLSCGIIPREGGDLREILTRLGGGFILHSEVTNVPKGSGLGTSSILSAACVKAVFEFMGIPYTENDLYDHVLATEQIMSTGGGWQDQVGGVTPGLKYTMSLPGIEQQVRVTHVDVPETAKKELNERFVLIYTGQRRLARNLLRDVIGRYVGGEPESLYALEEIQKSAALMRFELERGNVDGFAKLLNDHWKLSLMIDAGSSNTLIDQIFASIDDLIDGRLVCGAGGGGFLQVVLKKGVTRKDIRKRLKAVFMDSPVDVADCELVWE